MRTFGTLFVVAVFGAAMGCGGGSSGGSSPTSGRTGSNGGQCPASSKGQTCTGEQAYQDCSMASCGTPYKTCFGANYAKGDFTGGVCADFMACQLKCPCGTAEATTCETTCAMQLMQTTAGQNCMTCLTALATCVQAAACAQPVCTTPGSGVDGGTTPVGGVDAAGTTAGSCAAAQACCTKLASLSPAAAQSCTTAVSSAGGQDTACASILEGLKSGGLCP